MENLTDEQLRRVTGDELRRLQAKLQEHIQEHCRLTQIIGMQRRLLMVLVAFLAVIIMGSLWMLAVLK